MPAIDTIASFQTTVGSTLAAGVMATGDSATIRNAPLTNLPQLIEAMSDCVTTAMPWRVRSPLLHDVGSGIRFPATTLVSGPLLPMQFAQPLRPQDTLIIELSTAASTGKNVGVLEIFYPQLSGVAARLAMAGDVDNNVKSIKLMQVAIGSGANTAGIWWDQVITTTENLLHANTDYAVLGILTDVAVACLAIKGIDTGNLRVGCPGWIQPNLTAEYFRDLSVASGLPTIPIINAANANGTYVSLMSSAATGAILNATLVLAEMATPMPGPQ
jgi:hypothetical protein